MLQFTPGINEKETAVYEAFEDGNYLGNCTAVINGITAEITEVNCSDDIIAEGLIRSVLNCCAKKGAYLANIKEELLSPAFIRLGFSENRLTREIPEVLTGSCCSCRN